MKCNPCEGDVDKDGSGGLERAKHTCRGTLLFQVRYSMSARANLS